MATQVRVTPEVAAVIKRYTDAYRVAATIVRLGGLIKNLGAVVGFLLVIGASFNMQKVDIWRAADQNAGLTLILAGVVAGFFIGFVFYVVGVIVAARGQMLRASLDCAINGSPFLTNELKAQVMNISEHAIELVID